ncbi:MAG TPA: M90 family metallopeptidase [Geobacteraceae bacterium]
MLLITKLRRRRLKEHPFPPAWRAAMERHVPLYRRLPANDRHELEGHIQVFLAEKSFEGRGGLSVTDEVRVTIAAQACILLLHRWTDYYPGLSSVIVYPGEYLAPYRDTDEWGIVTEGTDRRSGESCPEGALVLSWEDVLAERIGVHAGYNVVLHEFAHLIDADAGLSSGTPPRSRYGVWDETLKREYERLRDDAENGRPTVLDPYGTEDLAEFFAVATEAFFETPLPLRKRHPELYAELARYYRQDPAAWAAPSQDRP